MPPHLQVEGLTKLFGDQTVLEDVTFSIAKGRTLSLIGPSGAGKTTLLRSILGTTRPDAGSVWLGGTDVTTLPTGDRHVGMVFQQYSLFPFMTVRENISFPLKAQKLRSWKQILRWPAASAARTQIRQRTDEVLELVGLSQHAKRHPSQLSGGEQQRVAIARAVALRPALLCLDEPFAALDEELRAGLQAQLLRIKSALNQTILYVTHDQSDALLMGDELAVIRQGRIVQLGPPDQVYGKPANSFVARFLGGCNLFKIRAVEHRGDWVEVITTGGTRFKAREQDGPWEALVGIRPEELRICGAGEATPNSLDGTVCSRSFTGPAVETGVSLQTGELLSVKTLSTKHAAMPAVGEQVRLCYALGSVIGVLDA